MIWFTSDTHFGHANVIKYCKRPYKDVTEMNEMLVVNWNSVVKPDDTVYFLGDFSLSFTAVETYTKRLMGRKIMIAGNHDFCHPAHKKSRTFDAQTKWEQKYIEAGWIDAMLEMTTDFGELPFQVQMTHMPYFENADDKHSKFRLPDQNGLPLLCGHVHELWRTKCTKLGTPMINVGCDVWDYTPVSLGQLNSLMQEMK